MAKTSPFDLHADAYEAWFERNPNIYQAELEALSSLNPLAPGDTLEVGVGSGQFAVPLNVRYGLEPSPSMADRARRRGVVVVSGVAEALPFLDASFDLVLFVTTICFVDDPGRSLAEAFRVLKPGGYLLLGFVDGESELGRLYAARRHSSLFYRNAVFFSVPELSRLLDQAGFSITGFKQTLLPGQPPHTLLDGWGKGSFVVIRTQKG